MHAAQPILVSSVAEVNVAKQVLLFIIIDWFIPVFFYLASIRTDFVVASAIAGLLLRRRRWCLLVFVHGAPTSLLPGRAS